MTHHIRFVSHLGKQILLIDFSNRSPVEVAQICREIPDLVTTRPLGSISILSDFTGASLDEESMLVMKETAVFDKPYVKKSAMVGMDNLPQAFSDSLSAFSRRTFHTFKSREEALGWLVHD
jgi:hypothetical protein